MSNEKTKPQFSPDRLSLMTAVVNLEKEIATQGWDQAPTLYALVPTQRILPHLELNLSAAELSALKENLAHNPTHLTPVLQDQLPTEDLTQVLGKIIFGEDVQGVALALERFVISPELAAQGPQEDPAQLRKFLLNHPERKTVRLVLGVDRAGHTWGATRSKDNDQDELVGQGDNLIPELNQALQATLVSDQELAQLSGEEN